MLDGLWRLKLIYLPKILPLIVIRGKTNRCKSLFGEAGRTYVHSMHGHCLIDVVTEEVDIPSSVLIRAVEPIQCIDKMKQFRNTENVYNLTNGPGKLCKAFKITREHDGLDLTAPSSPIFISNIESPLSNKLIKKTPRIGISKGKDFLLRFSIKNNPFVSYARKRIV